MSENNSNGTVSEAGFSEFDYIRNTYGVPAKRGARVAIMNHHQPDKEKYRGTITSAKNGYIRIRRDGEQRTYPAPFHPTWMIKYLPRES